MAYQPASLDGFDEEDVFFTVSKRSAYSPEPLLNGNDNVVLPSAPVVAKPAAPVVALPGFAPRPAAPAVTLPAFAPRPAAPAVTLPGFAPKPAAPAVVRPPVAAPVVVRPPVVRPPVAAPVVRPPVAAPVVRPPVAAPVVRPPVAAPAVVRPPVAAPVVRPPVAAPVVRPPVAAPVVRPPVHKPHPKPPVVVFPKPPARPNLPPGYDYYYDVDANEFRFYKIFPNEGHTLVDRQGTEYRCRCEKVQPDLDYISRAIVGNSIEDARRIYDNIRVVILDGQNLPVTMDYRPERINVEVVDGIVTQVLGYY